MMCIFAGNSSADGCGVRFISEDSTTDWFIPKDKTEDIATMEVIIPEGDHDVYVYDVVRNVTITDPAYTTHYYLTTTTTGVSIDTEGTMLK